MPQYQLGSFRFESETLIARDFERETEFVWSSRPRLNRSPGQQFIAKGVDKIKLSGLMFPCGSKSAEKQISLMMSQASIGIPFMLIDGSGYIYGRWVIKNVREKREKMMPNSSGMKVGFEIQIEYFGEDNELSVSV